jgi:hypothetical protein
MESIASRLPDMGSVVAGYEFKDGQLKANVDYWVADDKELLKNGDIVLLTNEKSMMAFPNMTTVLTTQLTLLIKPPTMVFVYFLLHPQLINMGANVIASNVKDEVKFLVSSATGKTISIPKGESLGYGYFQPIIPMNNISLNKQNATT